MAATNETSVFGAQPVITSERAGNAVANLLRLAILEGRLQPGAVLQEKSLAEELGISRTPIREAIIELRNEGLVESTATRRAVVRSYSADELRDVYNLRAALEGFAAQLSASRANDGVIRKLEESNARFSDMLDRDSVDVVDDLINENLDFHDIIAEASEIPRLNRMINQVMVIPMRYRAYAAYTPQHRQTVLKDHQQITDAIRERDSDLARDLMEQHVRWTGNVAVEAQDTAPPRSL
ncbi:MAG: GntR family transcriptional regulator [Gaiellales bacterium]